MNVDFEKILLVLSNMSQDEMNDICDLRDNEEFESSWNEVYDLLGSEPLEYHPNQKDYFIKMSDTTSCHEITEYISDDLDLIYNAEKKNISTPFLEILKASYSIGEIPKSV